MTGKIQEGMARAGALNYLRASIGRLESSLIASGKLLDEEGKICREFNEIGLHDAVVTSWAVINGLTGPSELWISGIFPDLVEIFNLVFKNPEIVKAAGFRLGAQFGIEELVAARQGELVYIEINGEFSGQDIQFKCSSAEYERYRLKDPMSREDLGWV